jgi:hypothetical protein
MSERDRVELPGLPHRGVELDELQIWRDAESGNVIFQVPPGREQVVFTPEQWARAVLFLALDDDDEGLGLA